jgi:ATP-binding cassette subfamily B (MDR/TAP) protein 1
VPQRQRAGLIKHAAWLRKGAPKKGSVAGDGKTGADVLFWSGGKDSFLALRALQREHANTATPIVLLTTFGANTRTVAHQEVEIEDIVRQAEALGLPLLGVPLHPGTPYAEQISKALVLLGKDLAGGVDRLVFGDLHLTHIREWRDAELGPLALDLLDGATLFYPLWQASYRDLMWDLMQSGVECELSAVTVTPSEKNKAALAVGSVFTPALAAAAEEEGWDAFGEKGEFHSLAKVWEL